jgi:hypothetical protein
VTAYAIVERVANPTPRLRQPVGDAPRDLVPLALPDGASLPRLEADDPEGLADRVAAIRMAFAQATWYLFNPDGWR